MTSDMSDECCILFLMSTFFNPVYIISVLIAISIHEWAHAYTADKLGDDTPRLMGRLTINPLAHVDLLGALMFVTVGFGWAKPVPVNPMNLRHPKRDYALVAVAGPFVNLVIAFVSFAALSLLFGDHPLSFGDLLSGMGTGGSLGARFLQALCLSSLFVNLSLMAFNLLPIPPLDGSNIVRMWIPIRYEETWLTWGQRGPIILLCLLLAESFLNVHILSAWVETIVSWTVIAFSFLLP